MKTKQAFVSRALNYDPLQMWAAVIPGQKTTWHATEKQAQILVAEWINRTEVLIDHEDSSKQYEAV